MERKLELKDIVGYFPYGLKTENHLKDDLVCAYTMNNGWIAYEFNSGKCLYNLIPILRPLSDLYKPIKHNGNEFIPIVELAKIVYPVYDRHVEKDDKDYSCYCSKFEFLYNNFSGSFLMWNLKNDADMPVKNQYQLFDKLHEWKIDYRGLIGAGLAIDVNTLKENPYEN
jgi:hypothetical protein